MKISEEEVIKVLKLSKLDKDSEDIELLREQLASILEEVEKILKLDVEGDIMISPSENKNVYFEDKPKKSISKKEMFQNVLTHDERYVEVVGVLND